LLSRAEKNKEKAEAKKKRKQRQRDKARREELKTLTELLSNAQSYCNKYIKLKHNGEPCYTCGQYRERYEAGHFRPVGKGLNWCVRFHHHNIRPQCHRCNNYEGGRLTDFEERLRKEVGDDMVDYIKTAPPYSFTREEAVEIKKHFMEECRRLTG
jgi:hypothetical protein